MLCTAPPEVVSIAKRLVDRLKISFSESTFENPGTAHSCTHCVTTTERVCVALQKHYAVLQAMALDEEVPEEVCCACRVHVTLRR